jgi:hypothetical protein
MELIKNVTEIGAARQAWAASRYQQAQFEAGRKTAARRESGP